MISLVVFVISLFQLYSVNVNAAGLKESDIYVGDKDEHGLPHGEGVLHTAEGIQYTGQWRNGMKDGKGRQMWPNGDEYFGEFFDGKMVGKGQLFRENGHRFIGDFVGGRFEGQGELYANCKTSCELVYNGSFADSAYNGHGIMYYNGMRTEGHYFKGFPDGPCKITTLTEDESGMDTNQGLVIYDGAMMMGKYHGKGAKYMLDDDGTHYKIYDGEWDRGKRHGEGTSFDKSGNIVYKGEWELGVPADEADEADLKNKKESKIEL